MDELDYEIHSESSHSAAYDASNIKSRNTDLNSRWTAAHSLNNEPQHIVLKMAQLCVLKSVQFGKFFKQHPCNVNTFEVWVGLEPTNMTLVIRDHLQNNPLWETFNAVWKDADGLAIPCRYVKLIPISTHHSNFHPSFWHVSLYGTCNPDQMQAISADLLSHKETRTLKLIAKYLRQRGFVDPCNQLLQQSGLSLEHTQVSLLRDAIMQGDWASAQAALSGAVESGLFDDHIRTSTRTLTWKRLLGTNADGDVPQGRTEHQMCIDAPNRKLYLLGGWDGKQHLRDLHEYDMATDRWRTVSLDVASDGGPPTLQNHRALYDAVEGSMYVLVPIPDEPPVNTTPGEDGHAEAILRRIVGRKSGKLALYRYTPRSTLPGPSQGRDWRCISADISAAGGPKYTQDYDAALDEQCRAIYMRTSTREPATSPLESQLHRYDMDDNRWTALPVPNPFPPLPGRLCTMRGEDGAVRLWMLGANGPLTATNVYSFHGRTSELDAVPPAGYDSTTQKPPSSIILERVLSDSRRNEVYVFHETRNRKEGVEPHPNTLWIYQSDRRRWMTTVSSSTSATKRGKQPPQERVLFQTEYDPETHSFYQFGGLLVRGHPLQKPLNQFWRAQLSCPQRADVLNRCIFLLREQQFQEMCQRGATDDQLLEFLRRDMVPFINKGERRELQDFCTTVARVYGPSPSLQDKSNTGQPPVDDAASMQEERKALFDTIVEMVNVNAKEPSGSLSDAVDHVL